MKTTIITNIKHYGSVTSNETVEDVFNKLLEKGSFIILTRNNSEKSKVVISKSSIKMVK